ncbi:uncharacterized protein CNMa [Prorops nasuta]|uniref:uncharacterized protein CNMa n=1 Tax=Prorops nasuta TaxID=863751 RepID=UPI0034CE07BA
MTGRSFAKRTILCLLGLLLSCSFLVIAEPEPVPAGMIYGDSYVDDPETLMLRNLLKQTIDRKQEVYEQERELAEEQIEIQAMLEAKAKEFSSEAAEMLPVPSAVVNHGPLHSGKRTSYMALCHFKICNMGRKRQL